MTRIRRATRSTSTTETSPTTRKQRYLTRSRLRKADLLLGGEGRINRTKDKEYENRAHFAGHDGNAGKPLNVRNANINTEENGQRHHTVNYQAGSPVVRRGWPFSLTVHFDRDVDVENDDVILQLTFGSRPQVSKGTLVRAKVELKDNSRSVHTTEAYVAKATKVTGRQLDISVTTPANAFVGQYNIFLETRQSGVKSSKRKSRLENGDIYIVFNPWCKDDVVYMEDERERQEYVMNEYGRIWRGTYLKNEGTPWYYGQFEKPVLDAALFLMDKAEVKPSARAGPVAFVRAISALVNSNDDDGVLVGRWTKTYPKGSTPPSAWTGSVKILDLFMSRKKPVKFGQCWVFAGLATSLLRALGIPTRCVTNFSSAHDTDTSMTVDYHFDEDNQPINDMNDSVWNFHVWNESYFKRVDLPEGYDGWQVHDATPQELSEGVMRCGPAPVKAVKNGHIYLNYDVPFVFSEVNGDKVMWKVSADSEMKLVDIDSHAIGKCISTKEVGSNLRHDLTLDYKYPDGSKEEKDVLKFVNQYSSRAKYNIYDRANKDVTFEISMTPTNVVIGEKFMIAIHTFNKSKLKCKTKGRVTLSSCFYTGVTDSAIKSQLFEETLAPKSEHSFTMEVVPNEYLNKLNPDACIMVNAILKVKETKQNFARSFSFTLSKPNLIFKIPQILQEKKDASGIVKFINSVGIKLTGVTIQLEGSCISSTLTHSISKAIKPGEKVKIDFKIHPKKPGYSEIGATFNSNELSGVDGSIGFHILPVK